VRPIQFAGDGNKRRQGLWKKVVPAAASPASPSEPQLTTSGITFINVKTYLFLDQTQVAV
jgi:hypothetical protein